MIATGDAEAVAIAFLKNEKPELVWSGIRALLPKTRSSCCSASASSPTPPARGGWLAVTLENLDTEHFYGEEGPDAGVPPGFLERSGYRPAVIDAHSAYYTLLPRVGPT